MNGVGDDYDDEAYKNEILAAEDDKQKSIDRIASDREMRQQMLEARAISEAHAKARRVKFGKGRGYYVRVPNQYRRKAF